MSLEIEGKAVKATFGFGRETLELEVPEKNYAGTLTIGGDVLQPLPAAEEIGRSMKHPIGSKRLKEIVAPGEKIAIITSDITRPLPTFEIMPGLLDELYDAGVRPEDITLVFALGSHRRHTPQEMEKLAGKRAMKEITVIDGDDTDCIYVGTTTRGTPVNIVRSVALADRRICLGNIEYHYFAGYSGGGKAIMPGVSTRDAIQANHSKMVEQSACAGKLEGNPVREDIEEAAHMVGVDFIINVVLDEKKRILKAFSGDCVKAHREGCRFLDSIYLCEIDRPSDIVVVSQGGYPKDINLYQTQKALDNAKHAVAKDGIIILVGGCDEGFGEHVFEEWIHTAQTPESMIERVKDDFQLGGHKAAAIAMVLENAKIFLVSNLPDQVVRQAFMEPFSSIQDALHRAFEEKGGNASVLLMPYGGSTLPRVKTS